MTTFDIPTQAAQSKADRRRTLLVRSALIVIVVPVILYALYLILLAPAQYQTTASFAVRGSQAAPADALGALGIVAPSSNSNDARIVETYILSHAMVEELRERFGFNEAYSHFSLDPWSYLAPSATIERAVAFWRGRVQLIHDPNSASTTVQVSAYSPEDAQRLTQGVLTLSEELVNTMSDRAIADLAAAADREIVRKREEYEAARDALTEVQGRRFSGVDASAPAQQASELVGSLDSSLAEKRIELATAAQIYQPQAPQIAELRREIAALEAERARAIRRAAAAPGENAAGGQIDAQAELLDYEFARQSYQMALQAAEAARRQDITERKYIVAYIPPEAPQRSNWWSRLSNIFALLIAMSLAWGAGALIYSIIRDHMDS